MRYCVLAAALVLVAPFGCDSADGDGDADADLEEGCGEIGQGCNESTSCPPAQVCHEHTCDCAFGRDYEIELIQAAVYARAPGGHCWEDDPPSCADLPDVYAVMRVGDRTHTTQTVEGSLNPIWNEKFTVRIDRDTRYGVWLYDEDPGDDQLVLEFDGLLWGFTFTEDNLRNAWMFIQQGDAGAQTRIDFILSPR